MFPGEPLIVVVSAFGKTTNALEELVRMPVFTMQGNKDGLLREIIDYHTMIYIHQCSFPDPGKTVTEGLSRGCQ